VPPGAGRRALERQPVEVADVEGVPGGPPVRPVPGVAGYARPPGDGDEGPGEAAPPSATIAGCLTAALAAAAAAFTPERHDLAPQRRTIIAAHSELQERELLKRAAPENRQPFTEIARASLHDLQARAATLSSMS